MREQVERLFARYVEEHVVHGRRPDPKELCSACPELVEPLRELIRRYEQVDQTLTASAFTGHRHDIGPAESLPSFPGFRTIERLGSGGVGEVFKLEDLELGRTVAAKIVRPDPRVGADVERFLREARSLALFEDPRIVRVYEFRAHADPPVLLMEYVDGFELSHIGRSLEYPQRARLMVEIADAIHRAHTLGIQHRDLKPGNILVDARLTPRILDFGLAGGDPDQGHGVGTPAYMAPEQLAPGRPIDARTDVYALGVVLYELLCGVLPFQGSAQGELLSAIRGGEPRLPVEIEPEVPETLQAIALKAMAADPAERYSAAREMALDLERYLDGRPVTARPTLYHTVLQKRVRPHLEQIREWLRLKLIYTHEAERLGKAYHHLEAREDDWIVESRSLSLSKIALYLGAFLLGVGGLLYFVAYHQEAVAGWIEPAATLAVPFLGLSIVGNRLFRREQRAVAIAFHLGAAVLLPLFLLIVFQEAGWWPIDPQNNRELLAETYPSNRQLQVASLTACLWACWLALTTRTVALSACFTVLAVVFNFAVLGEFDLRGWLTDGRYDLLATHLVPCFVFVAVLGYLTEMRQRPWFTRPLYLTGAGLLVVILELLALKGKAFEHLGITMTGLEPAEVSNPTLLETITAMTLNGLIIYLVAWVLEKRGTLLMKANATMLYMVSPFAILEPLAWLNRVGEYSRRFDWLYLTLALTITFASHFRQRKSFYYAGLINTGLALWLITDHYDWFDRPAWAIVIVMVAVVVLLAGAGLDVHERRRRSL